MPRVANITTPKYCKHKASGQAIVALNGRDFYLGPYGTAASHAEYDRVISEWMASGRSAPVKSTSGLTVIEIINRYRQHALVYYRKNGRITKEVAGIAMAAKYLKRLYGRTAAAEFGPLALKAVREVMIKDGLCLTTINTAVGRIKRFFRWAVSNELVPSSVIHALQTVDGLKIGRSEARDPRVVRAVPDNLIEAILPHVSRQVAAMIEIQRLTGMRSGEMVIMRGCDIDMSGRIWLYTPSTHKTQHHGHVRAIYLGPQAQAKIRPFLKTDLSAYLFVPAEAEAERKAEMRRQRKTNVQPSQMDRRRSRPKRKPGERYDVQSYKRAVCRGCDHAFPPPESLRQSKAETHEQWMTQLTPKQKDELKQWRKANRWHPHQLRHNAATRLRKEFGIEAARVVLGHRSAAITEIYAEADRGKAAEIMLRVG